MLLVELRDLQKGPVDTVDRVPPDDELFAGLEPALATPLAVEGRLQATGESDLFWNGHLAGEVTGLCRRCLTPVRWPVEADVAALFSADPEAGDDPEVYPLPPRATQIDLRPVVREELLLAVPSFLLCREGCAGLCPKCGADLNQGPCGCAAPKA
ncbi:MAG: YceD family protein [Gemmatimonadales bacterium]